MPSSAAELTTVTVCAPASVVSCFRGCKPSRTPLPVSSLWPEEHVTLILRQLHQLPIRQRIFFKTAVLVYKYWHNMAPSYLSTYCIPTSAHDGRCQLRSADLFHARRRTTATAALLLVVRSCGTVRQLHFD